LGRNYLVKNQLALTQMGGLALGLGVNPLLAGGGRLLGAGMNATDS
jgi:hypothetical protein